MHSQSQISFRVNATAPGLALAVKIDGREIWSGDACGGHDLAVDIADDDGSHMLTFELSGKNAAHTKIDSAGNITEDVTVSIEHVKVDEIDLGYILHERTIYEHDYNGTGDLTQDKFYGTMGCNGTVTLPFTTPVYLWLLENM